MHKYSSLLPWKTRIMMEKVHFPSDIINKIQKTCVQLKWLSSLRNLFSYTVLGYSELIEGKVPCSGSWSLSQRGRWFQIVSLTVEDLSCPALKYIYTKDSSVKPICGRLGRESMTEIQGIPSEFCHGFQLAILQIWPQISLIQWG